MSSTRVTMKDIAAQVGVSVNTVHKVISNKPGVSDAVRAQILMCAEELGYHRNESASILRRKDIRVVVMMPSTAQEGSFYFAYLWRGVEQYARESRDHSLTIEFRPYEMGCYAEVLAELGVDAPTPKDKGRIMKTLMPRLKGQADGAVVNAVVSAAMQA